MGLPTWLPNSRTCDRATFRRKNGRQKGECTWCGGPLPGRRIFWCSEDCIDEFGVRYWPNHAAIVLRRRDNGICALCGDDMEGLRENIDEIRRELRSPDREYTYSEGVVLRRSANEEMKLLYAVLEIPWDRQIGRLWDVDHIVPAIEGGANIGASNLRTACFSCHKIVTAKLAAKRAAFRRLEKEVERRKVQPVLFETEAKLA